jgi:hypothetical protein
MREMFFRRVSSPVMADFGDPIAERRKKNGPSRHLFPLWIGDGG